MSIGDVTLPLICPIVAWEGERCLPSSLFSSYHLWQVEDLGLMGH